MRTITHRELRNESGRVLRDVAAGHSLLVTNNGEVVARISPASETEPGLRVSRPAARHGFSGLQRHRVATTTDAVLTELRGER